MFNRKYKQSINTEQQFSLIVLVYVAFCFLVASFDKFWDFEYNGKKPLIPYYLPPKALDIISITIKDPKKERERAGNQKESKYIQKKFM